MVEKGKNVTIHYTLTVEGQVIDSSREGDPFEYRHGDGQIISGLERHLEGLGVGDRRQVTVGPDDGYGPVDPKAIVEIPKENLPSEDLQTGTAVQGKGKDGRVFQGVVRQIGDENVTVDFNHPLAGKELLFDVEILKVA